VGRVGNFANNSLCDSVLSTSLQSSFSVEWAKVQLPLELK